MEKNLFESPKIEVVELEVSDIIATSGDPEGGVHGPGEGGIEED